MGVQNGTTGSSIFVLGKQTFQFGIFFCPVALVWVKDIRQTAPADILRKNLLFLGGGSTMLLLQLEQGADGFNVPGIFLFCAALAQMIVRDVEVSGSFRHRFGVQSFVCGSGIRESLHLSVHYSRDGQFVQFFVRRLRLVLVC